MLQLIHGDQSEASGWVWLGVERSIFVHAARSIMMVIAFFIVVGLQIVQPQFLSPDLSLPVYGVLGFVFLVNSVFFLSWPRWTGVALASVALVGLDVVAISSLVHLTGGARSLFFFLYLVHILVSALLTSRNGALAVALWSSVCYSAVLTLSSSEESLWLLVALNNAAFFAMAMVGGSLAEQLVRTSDALRARTRDLSALSDFHKLIVENISTGLLTLDLGGRIETANPAASRILDGLALEGRQVQDLFSQVALGENVVSLRGGDAATQFEETFVNRRREKLLLDVSLSPLRDGEGGQIGYVILFQDKTEVKRLEAAMRQKEKLAAVGQLAAGIAHEIRNPLASLSGSVQLMASQPEQFSEENLKLMRIVLREMDRLNGLITEFLDYVRPSEPVNEVVDVNRVAKEVVEVVQLNKALREGVEVVLELKAGGLILGDRNKLQQALLNLVINAFHAMEKVESPRLSVTTEDRLDWVEVLVSDNGCGMNSETLARIFEPFFTTKAKGTGLGLALTHKIFEAHGAQVQVESEVGRGTRFRVLFPAHMTTKDRGRPRSVVSA